MINPFHFVELQLPESLIFGHVWPKLQGGFDSTFRARGRQPFRTKAHLEF